MPDLDQLKAALPRPVRALARRIRQGQRPVVWGNLRRRRPFSDSWGFDRGLPVDRFYIEDFLSKFEADVRGRVLEVQDSAYTNQFGGSRVTASDILDINQANKAATIVADLARSGSLPDRRFDCIIVTQTLQYVDDPAAAVANLWTAVAPGGTLLITVPCAQRIAPDLSTVDRWRFMPRGLEDLVRRNCAGGEIEVVGYGNVLSATASLMGLAADELRTKELEDEDPNFPLVACARVHRST
jgi:SAM-dependent methyltransferase